MKTKNTYFILFLFYNLACPLIASTNRLSRKRPRIIESTNQNFLKKQEIDFDQNLKDLNKTREKLNFLEKALQNHDILKDSEYSGLYFHEIYDRDEGEYVVVGEKTPEEREMGIKNLIAYRINPEYNKLRTQILENDTIQRFLKR